MAALPGTREAPGRGSPWFMQAGSSNRHYSIFEKSEILNAETRISRSRSALSGDLETLKGIGIKLVSLLSHPH